MKWDYETLNVFLDISTYCNAGCPQCHRTDTNGLGKSDWLPLIQWDLKTFQQAFPIDELANIEEFNFCGTWGDPVMCKELYEIIEYVMHNSNVFVKIHTNGSMRNEDWWWNIGALCEDRLAVYFAVDGINQEMHEKYRRFTNLEKVLSNMETLSQTRAKIHSQTVLFKHNQDYKNQIMEMCKSRGSEFHTSVTSDRFDGNDVVDGKRHFVNESGEDDYLEEADLAMPGAHVTSRSVAKLEEKIICRWAKPRNEVVINPDGQVLPCCFHSNVHYRFKMQPHGSYGKELNHHPVYKDNYNKNLKDYNVLYKPLSEIMRSKWYTETLPNSIKGNNPIHQCKMQCSSIEKKSHQIRIVEEL